MDGNRPTLLVIDDDEAVLETMSLLLENFGFQVLGYGNPADALERFKVTPRISAVICDFRMPEMSGTQVAIASKKINPHVPVIIVSGNHPPEQANAPWDAWFVKGGAILELVGQLRNIMLQKAS